MRTATDVTVLMLPRKQAVELSAEHPGIGQAFTWLAISETAILRQWAVGLGRRPALGRLAHLLCELSIRVARENAGNDSFELPLTQEVIGDALGLPKFTSIA
ncbi:Crp/Fnr family transcriptional regulator [Sphingomonas prati]|uniref:CRP-like cAMP-binding protein n=1 Tax=Sphingomonas prati TaxID=1843237 RepID=A0A7W9BVH7_9SPHN|nr:Crp/Fnr family transcriptional regulator [Sphingomonas prati]MBB5730845.1 CRP-like cAMP-binding protein [Sphingomonas prati]GGE97303.1 hypothetical protein GCM10011404_33060 [Sphingomonas prati]